MSLLLYPPVSIMSLFNIMMCLSRSLTLPQTARHLSSNLCDEEHLNAAIHRSAICLSSRLSPSIAHGHPSRRLCHPANVPRLIFCSFSLFHFCLSLNSHSVRAQDNLRDKVSSCPPLPAAAPSHLSPFLPPLPLFSLLDQRGLWGLELPVGWVD